MEYHPGGDIFATNADCIINPVNCVGVMGKGLALAFKQRFPGMMPPYEAACQKGQMKPGSVQLVSLTSDGRRAPKGMGDIAIANVATKDHWRDPSRLEWVDEGLRKLAGAVEARGIRSVAIPMLGAGLGGLDWRDVRKSVETHFRPLSEKGVRVVVLGDGPEHDRSAAPKSAARPTAPSKARPASSGKAKWPALDADLPADYKERDYYAGIGARDTPEREQKRMEKIGDRLAREGMVLRSGAADGADSAFERGCDAASGKKEIFLPWDGFEPKRGGPIKRFADGVSVFATSCGKEEGIASRFHPIWDSLRSGPRAMMARNANQMLGRDCETPSRLVVCYTEKGLVKGGTGQSLRMAGEMGIEVLNLGDPRVRVMPTEALCETAVRMARGEKLDDILAQERKQKRSEVVR